MFPILPMPTDIITLFRACTGERLSQELKCQTEALSYNFFLVVIGIANISALIPETSNVGVNVAHFNHCK